MIGLPGNVRVYRARAVEDMRKGFDTVAAQVQTQLRLDPHDRALYLFVTSREFCGGNAQGLCLFYELVGAAISGRKPAAVLGSDPGVAVHT